MKKITTMLMGVFISVGVFAQTGEIKGKVFDMDTKETIIGANVWVDIGDQKIGVATDVEGRYTIKPLTPGTYDVHYSFVGYTGQITEKVQVTTNNITFLDDVELLFGITGGEAIVVGYRVPLIEKDGSTKMTVLAEDLESNPLKRDIGAYLAASSPDIYQADAGQPLYVRGSRAGTIQYIVDGMKTSTLGMPSTAIGEMTVYTGGIPAKYGDTMSGVIIVETKSYFSEANKRK